MIKQGSPFRGNGSSVPVGAAKAMGFVLKRGSRPKVPEAVSTGLRSGMPASSTQLSTASVTGAP